MAAERLQKILAAAGVASRRACELLILDGRVSVNGQVVRTLPVLADPTIDRILVDGKPVAAQRHVYFILHKPRGVVCTNNDPAGRTRAVDLLGPQRERVYPVGRLDAESTGLLLLTNDGELAQRLTHPRYGVPKTYQADIDGRIEPAALEQLRKGVWLPEGRTAPAETEIRFRSREKSVLEVTLRDGRDREVRRVLARLGHKVRKLKRIAFGPLRLEGMPLGAFRPLDKREVALLRKASETSTAPIRPTRPRPSTSRAARDSAKPAPGERKPAAPRGEKRAAGHRARGSAAEHRARTSTATPPRAARGNRDAAARPRHEQSRGTPKRRIID